MIYTTLLRWALAWAITFSNWIMEAEEILWSNNEVKTHNWRVLCCSNSTKTIKHRLTNQNVPVGACQYILPGTAWSVSLKHTIYSFYQRLPNNYWPILSLIAYPWKRIIIARSIILLLDNIYSNSAMPILAWKVVPWIWGDNFCNMLPDALIF